MISIEKFAKKLDKLTIEHTKSGDFIQAVRTSWEAFIIYKKLAEEAQMRADGVYYNKLVPKLYKQTWIQIKNELHVMCKVPGNIGYTIEKNSIYCYIKCIHGIQYVEPYSDLSLPKCKVCEALLKGELDPRIYAQIPDVEYKKSTIPVIEGFLPSHKVYPLIPVYYWNTKKNKKFHSWSIDSEYDKKLTIRTDCKKFRCQNFSEFPHHQMMMKPSENLCQQCLKMKKRS